ncbi:MAG: hypothetical protein WBG02_17520 [Candidatus Acidiferrum sp.]
MTRLFTLVGAIFLCWVLTDPAGFAQSSSAPPANPDNANPPAASSAAAPHTAATSAAAADPKKSKKVWTNDNVGSLSGTVSVVGDSKGQGKTGSETKADPQYIASTRKQLEKLQSQLDDTNKQLADLTEFSSGKTAVTSGGYELNKGYNRVPVDQQISNLQSKKAQLEGKIDALLEEARKKGVEPGDLR